MITIKTPPGYESERRYIINVIFGDWLGLEWQHQIEQRLDVSVTIYGQPGEIRLPDTFWQQLAGNWLQPNSLPITPLPVWNCKSVLEGSNLTEPNIPVIYGDPEITSGTCEDNIYLPIDVLGSAFFMITRYEEIVITDRDEHNRFPAHASLAYRSGFLGRPIVDEYTEILWSAINRLWAGLTRNKQTGRTFVTCDMDNPFSFVGSVQNMVRRAGGDLLKRRSIRLATTNVVGELLARRGDSRLDPYLIGTRYIMDINEEVDRSVAFYFIPENTHPKYDKSISLEDPRMRALIREIHERGHEIGIHPGYDTYRNNESLSSSVCTMRRVLEEENINHNGLGGRQHYLRWDMATSLGLWESNKLDYDSTLCYAELPGFRCGTCREYHLYDLNQQRATRVRERPLIMMECSVISKRYMGMGYSNAALELMLNLRDTCYQMGGTYTVLWHNSHLMTGEDQRFYKELVS